MPIFDVISMGLIAILCAISGIAAGIIVWRILSLFMTANKLQKFLCVLIAIVVAVIYGFAMYKIGMTDADMIGDSMRKTYTWALFLPIPIAIVILFIGRLLRSSRR